MPYRICKSIEVENGHMLSKHPDKCRFPHGHTRKVELVLEADELDANDMVCDFKAVKAIVGEYLERLDHAMCMNVADPMYPEMKSRYGEQIIGYEGEDPTTEVLARTVYTYLQSRLVEPSFTTAAAPGAEIRYPVRPSVRVVRVRVWETSSSWAEYSAAASV